jgi:hypothetical protein
MQPLTRFHVVLVAALLPSFAGAATPAPFWQAFAGTWVSDASYFDQDMQPIVARYATLMRVEARDSGVVITEWKFYPDGELARGMAGGRLPGGRGLETITRSEARFDAAASGQLQFGADRGRWMTSSADLATGTIAGKGAAPRYRFVAALSGPDHAEFSTWGYHDDGAFKGIAIFRMRRIATADEEAQRQRLRQAFAVGLTLDQRATAPPPPPPGPEPRHR